MKWTKKAPTKPGWYWAKQGPGLIKQIVSVDLTKTSATVACSGDDFTYGLKDFRWWSDEPIEEIEELEDKLMGTLEILNKIAGKQGWSDETMLYVVLDYIDSQKSNDAFADFLRCRADEENTEAGR